MDANVISATKSHLEKESRQNVHNIVKTDNNKINRTCMKMT